MSSKLLFILKLLILSCLLPSYTNGAKILGLFAHPGKSHFDFFRPLLLGLARAGHDVHVLSHFPNKEPVANYTDYQITGAQVYVDIIDIQDFEKQVEFDAFPIKAPTFLMLHSWGLDSCRRALNTTHIQNILQSGEKFDLVVMEQFNNDCMLSVAHKLDVPVIFLSSCSLMPWHYKRMGSPMVLSHMPMNFLPHSEKMTFIERVNNFLHFHIVNGMYNYITQPATNALLREIFGSTIPPVEEMVKRASLTMVNQHYSLAGAYPYSPNIVEVGGLQIEGEKPLDTELKTLLDNSSHKGVIYISWGSMIRPETLSPEKRDSLIRVMNQFSDYLFLMKWPEKGLDVKPSNLVTRSWFSQRDVLCHPKVRAFLTHGGLLGTSEAVYCGVPMIVTPFYGDQFLNSKAISNRKIGIIVKYKDLTQNNIANALKTILTPSFRATVRKVSEAYRNRPIKPLDLSIWWVEQVIATGGIPLARSASIEMSMFAYSSMDVYLFLLLLVIALALVVRSIGQLLPRILRIGVAKKKVD